METVRLDREISQTTASSGVIVLSERVPSVRSVAVGIWVRSASAHEPRPKMGVSHLLEHMVLLGTRDTVGAMSTSDLKQLHERAYFPANCVIAAAGNLTQDRLLEELGKLAWFDRAPGNVERATPPVVPIRPAVRGAEARHAKDTAQTHIVFATDSVAYADRRKYALLVLANVFGGGMSSRLFQRIREELGLPYAIYAFTSFYRQVVL